MKVASEESGGGSPFLAPPFVAVVVPCFRAGSTVGEVLRNIGPGVDAIFVVDDGCPDLSGERALRDSPDPRLTVVHNEANLGVGGAMKRGYQLALQRGADIVVKIDADGQMDPRHISRLIAPIVEGRADYAKGNRFAPAADMPPGSCPGALGTMPLTRRVANQLLSIVHRVATGYWSVGDPANGYTAVHARALNALGTEALADCFFFETDMLFRLNRIGARVVDVPLPAIYPGSGTTLSLRRTAPRFASLIVRRTLQRLGAAATARLIPRGMRQRRDPSAHPAEASPPPATQSC